MSRERKIIISVIALLAVVGLAFYFYSPRRMPTPQEYPPIELEIDELIRVLSSSEPEDQALAEQIREAYFNLRPIPYLTDENVPTEERNRIIRLLEGREASNELPPGFQQELP